jgi:hypothetical protein
MSLSCLIYFVVFVLLCQDMMAVEITIWMMIGNPCPTPDPNPDSNRDFNPTPGSPLTLSLALSVTLDPISNILNLNLINPIPESTNGTWVNHIRVRHATVPLHHGVI